MNRVKEKWNGFPLTVKVSLAYAACSILQRCISFITLPLFTRLLSTEQYGQFTIYQSWHGIIAIAITLNLAYGSFSTAMVKYEDDRYGYISAVESICVVLSGLFLIIYLPFRSIWNAFFELPTFIICVMVFEILGVTSVQLWSGKKRFEYRYKEVIAVTLLISILSPLISFVLILNTNEKGYARIMGFALVYIIIGGVFFFRNAIKGKKLFDRKYWRFALGFNIPLLVYYLSQVIFNQSDRIMISHMVGKEKAAIYGLAYSLATILTFVINAVNNSYVPWFYGRIKEEKTFENRAVSVAISLLLAVLLSGIIWFAPELVLLMGGKKYLEAAYIIAPVSISILLLFYSQLFINVELYYEEKKSLVSASVFAAIINLVLNWIYIRQFGYYAAAYTTLISYIVFSGMNCFAMKKILKRRGIDDDAYDYRSLVILFMVFCATSLAGVLLYNNLIVRIVVSAAVLTLMFLKRELFYSMYRSVKQNK